MSTRNYKPFSEEQLKVIKEASGKLTMLQLSEKMNINYTNLSSAMKQHRVSFVPFRTPRKYTMAKPKEVTPAVKNGVEYLTDEMMREYSYMI